MYKTIKQSTIRGAYTALAVRRENANAQRLSAVAVGGCDEAVKFWTEHQDELEMQMRELAGALALIQGDTLEIVGDC